MAAAQWACIQAGVASQAVQPYQLSARLGHAALRDSQQAMATLKTWRLLRKLRCSTTRITGIVQAVLALHLASSA